MSRHSILWHIRRDLVSVGNNVIMTTVVGVGCKEPRAWKGLMMFRAKADVMSRTQWPSLPSQGVGGREKSV
jgi:hypothetical protein